MEWFRFYTDTISDIKIRRLPPSQRWLWVAVLTLARKSPQPGTLILSDDGCDVTVTSQDLADASHISLEETESGIKAFLGMNMLHQDEDGTYVVTHWHKRQFSSDDGSKERTRQYRRRQKSTNVTSQESHSDDKCDVTVTTPDTDTDTDLKEKKKNNVTQMLAQFFPRGISEKNRYDITEYMDELHDLELLNIAYKIAVEKDATQKDSYIKSVLRGFLNDGITTVAQYEARESQRQIAAGGDSNATRSGYRKEIHVVGTRARSITGGRVGKV